MAEVLGTVASIIAVVGLAQSAVSLLRDIKDASTQCNSIIIEISFTRGLLEGLKDTVSDLDASRTWTQTIHLLGQQDGPINCLEKVLRLLNSRLAKQASTSHSKKFMGNILWPFSKRESEEILQAIERQKLSLLLALENNHIRLAMAIREDSVQNGQAIEDLQVDVKGVIEGISKIEISLQDNLASEILSWISPVNARTMQDQISNNIAPGTGEWLFSMPEFQNWIKGDTTALFCPGIPGAGKSCIAARTIQHLGTRATFDSQKHSIAWLYCDYRENTVHSVHLFLASILKQILQYFQSIPGKVKDAYKSHGNGKTSISLVEVQDLLRSVIFAKERCFVVVDALDECTDTDGTRERLVQELRSLEPQISLLVTSRPVMSIETMFANAVIVAIEPHKEDLEIYIDRRLETEAKLHKIVQADQSLREEIKNTLISKNQGIFLMTKLHLDALAKKAKYSKKALRGALADLPQDLDKTYEDAMARISTQDEDDLRLALQVLSWVFLSFRRMTVRELQEALAVQNGDDEDDEESLIDPEFFISICGGLLVLDRSRYVQWISFVHLTTEEFFERNSAMYFPKAGFEISSTCLKQLTWRRISVTQLGRSPETAMNEFTEYAVRYAILHVEASWDPALLEALKVLWRSNHLYVIRSAFDYLTYNSAALTHREEKSLIHPYQQLTQLQLALLWDDDTEAQVLIEKGFTEDDTLGHATLSAKKVSMAVPAVCIAIHNHNLHILDRFIELGARLEVFMTDRRGRSLSSLECAIARDDQEMVKYLLDRAPHLKLSHSMGGRTPLHFAVECQLFNMVSFLMNEGAVADVNEQDSEGQTALHYLAKIEPENSNCQLLPTFKILEAAWADINPYDLAGNTPLDYVKRNRTNPIACELYDALCAKGAVTGWGKRLQREIYSGSQAAAKQLLDENTGAGNTVTLPKSITDGLLGALLARACTFSYGVRRDPSLECELATALVDLGASLENEFSRDPQESDLHWLLRNMNHWLRRARLYDDASRYLLTKTHVHVFRLLVANGADVDALSHECTPLFLAAGYGDVEIVQILLDNGADHSKGNGLCRPIEVAAWHCHARVVEALLKKKPQIEESLVMKVQSAVWSLGASGGVSFHSPHLLSGSALTFPQDRHQTMWLLCAYGGWDLPRSDEVKRLDARKKGTKLPEGGTASVPYTTTIHLVEPFPGSVEIQCSICSMEAYRDYSQEELRLADYSIGRT